MRLFYSPPSPYARLARVVCALHYIGFRHPDLGWRERCPGLAAWHAGYARRASLADTTLAEYVPAA